MLLRVYGVLETTWRPSRRGVGVLWLALVGVPQESVLLGTHQAEQASLSSGSPKDWTYPDLISGTVREAIHY